MLPDIQLAEKAAADNGAKQSIQGRATKAPWGDTVPGFGFLGDTMMVSLGQVADEVPAWSIYPQLRDMYLRKFYRGSDGALSSAIFTMQSKLGSLPYKVNAPGPRAKKRFSDLLGYAEFGQGFAQLLKMTAVDLYTQDNGWFWELIGAGRADKPLRTPVLQIAHLDSANCWRTFDPDFPVLYTNPFTGQYHKIHESRIVMGSSFPQSDELARGIGYCAVSRALRWAQYARDLIVYKHEKAGGRFKRAIGWGSGYTPQQFDKAMGQSDESNDAMGFTRFAQIPFLLTMKDNPQLNLLDLASLPDGFDSMTEQTLWMYLLALAFGTDARELWPATQSGATKADASIQNMKAQGKGFSEDVKSIEHAINWKIFPDGVSLEFDNKDDEQDQRVATLHQTHVTNVKLMQEAGDITLPEGRAILISKGVVDPEVIQNAASTAAPILADDSAPVDLGQQTPAQPGPTEAPPTNQGGTNQPGQGQPTNPPIGSKEDTPKETAPPKIEGKPLPTKQAIAVEPFSPAEIDAAFEAFARLRKGS